MLPGPQPLGAGLGGSGVVGTVAISGCARSLISPEAMLARTPRRTSTIITVSARSAMRPRLREDLLLVLEPVAGCLLIEGRSSSPSPGHGHPSGKEV